MLTEEKFRPIGAEVEKSKLRIANIEAFLDEICVAIKALEN